MKDNEDRMIDLIFYCVGCNVVDILGMVGEFSLLVSGEHHILSRKHWSAVHPADTRPAQAQDRLPQVRLACCHPHCILGSVQ